MNWKDITIRQFQQIISIDKSLNPLDRSIKIASALSNIQESEIEEMPPRQFNDLCKKYSSVSFITDKPVRFIKLNKKRFKIIYDLTKLTIGQKRKLQSLGDQIIDFSNMHIVAACFIQQVNRFGRVIKTDPSELSNELLDCSIVPIVTACRFYTELFLKTKDHE